VEDMDYLDLEINVARNIRTVAPNGIFNLPKLITRGEKKGKADFVRRENVDIFPLTVVTDSVAAVLEESNAEIAVPAAPSMAGIPSA
jgi:predicted RecA/RadA family phage recombinase